MKNTKLYRLLIILLLSITVITACAGIIPSKTTEPSFSEISDNEATNYYHNGIFIGYSDASDHGYAMAVITMEDDRIVDVILKEFTELSIEKDFASY